MAIRCCGGTISGPLEFISVSDQHRLSNRLTKRHLTVSVHASPFSLTMVGDQESGLKDCTTQFRLPEPPLAPSDMALLRMLPAAQPLNQLQHVLQLQQHDAGAQAAATHAKCRRISLIAGCCTVLLTKYEPG